MDYKIATYKASKNTDFAGNPFIECLPDRLSAEDFWEQVQDEVEVPDNLAELDNETLEEKAANIMKSVSPTSIYYDVYCDLLRTLKIGYQERNPLSPETKKWQQKAATASYRRTRTSAPALKFTGYSGMGKTTLTEAVLTVLDPVIIHPADGPLGKEVIQIVYLKVNIPGDSSTKDICLDLFEQIDGILKLEGKDRYSVQYEHSTRTKCIRALVTLCSTLLIGMIIFDEMQNICIAKANEKNLVFKFFDKLTNEAKVPTLKIGTSKADNLTDAEFSNAKRLGVPHDWKNYSLNDPDWKNLVEYAWNYQLLPKFTELTPELRTAIYNYTWGIPHCLFFLIEQANVWGLRKGKDYFSISLLNDVFNTRFTILKTAIIALRHGNVEAFDGVMGASQYIDKEVKKHVKKLISVASNKSLNKEEAKSLLEHLERYLPEYKLNKTETVTLKSLAQKADVEASTLFTNNGYLGVPL